MSRLFFFISLWTSCVSALAAPISYMGTLVDPNAVAIIEFTQARAAPFLVQSWGYGGTAAAPGGTNAASAIINPGGFDAYASLFQGWGNSATFLASNDDGPCPPGTLSPECRDPQLTIAFLIPGNYTLVISQWDNFSFAENYGSGTLGDGFIGLAADFEGRTANWAVDVSFAVPEPAPFALVGIGFAGLVLIRRKRTNLLTTLLCRVECCPSKTPLLLSNAVV